MGIFKTENLMQAGVDYAAALSKIETELQKSQEKRAAGEVEEKEKKKEKSDTEFDENDDLYNQGLDEEGNLI